MSRTHLSTVRDVIWVQVPGGRNPDGRVHVSEPLYTCLICVLFCLIWLCSVGASSVWVCCGLVWYCWHRTVSCSWDLLTLLVATYVLFCVLSGLFFLLRVTSH